MTTTVTMMKTKRKKKYKKLSYAERYNESGKSNNCKRRITGGEGRREKKVIKPAMPKDIIKVVKVL